MRIFGAAAAVSLLTLSVAALQSQGGSAAPQVFPLAAVKIVPAGLMPLDDASEYVATLKSLHSTTIQPQIDGQITHIYVKSGDRVPEGARLGQIDPRRQQAAVSSQEAERAAKEAN